MADVSRNLWPAYAAGIGLLIVGLALIAIAWPFAPEPTVILPPPTILASTLTPEPLIPTPTLTPEPLIPTPTPALTAPDEASPSPAPTTAPTASALSTSTPSATSTAVRPLPALSASPAPSGSLPPKQSAVSGDLLWQGRARWCAAGASGDLGRFDIAQLRLGWYLDWRAQSDLIGGGELEYARMVRLGGGALTPNAQTLTDLARRHPGALWLIGNEPDVNWQDNVVPADYARLYHEAYTALKRGDGQAQIAIGGVTQPTPLRLRYLDAVLAAYREQFGVAMPVDVWNVHNFLLREERGTWGVEIPPGFPDEHGRLYEISDSANLVAFKEQIIAFRRWMAERGFRNSPLIVSEYGIPMPEDYGFPPELVAAFLTATFDFFLTATDPALGYLADANRLVQRWCWYSLADTLYPTGNLFDPQTGEITPLGRVWAAYVHR